MEILKVILCGVYLLILDEFSFILLFFEIEWLFVFFKCFCVEGYLVVFIMYKFGEVFEVVDWVVVLCDGQVVGVMDVVGVMCELLVCLMVGCELVLLVVCVVFFVGKVWL